MPWRAEDEVLLQRLEDESLIEHVFAFLTKPVASSSAWTGTSAGSATIHPRAGGLIAELRRLPGGAEAVRGALAGDVPRLVRFVLAIGAEIKMRECSPALLHHLALFHARAAKVLEAKVPETAASAWVRALGAWMALAEERAYLAKLEDAIVAPPKEKEREKGGRTSISPERAPLELIADVAKRADAAARDLAAPGKAALLALTRTEEAARVAGASAETARRARIEADRRRNAAIEAALAVIAEGLEEANVRGELATSGRLLLLRAVSVWSWTSHDEHVEQFVVDRIEKIGWELYRARNWDSLRYLLDPFCPMFDSLASRIERDPSQIAYAAGCAQMFVFLSELEPTLDKKIATAERAVKVCPTHRNGRLVLASFLCDKATEAMRLFGVLTPAKEVEHIEAMIARAEDLYPQTSELPEAKKMLERVKKGGWRTS